VRWAGTIFNRRTRYNLFPYTRTADASARRNAVVEVRPVGMQIMRAPDPAPGPRGVVQVVLLFRTIFLPLLFFLVPAAKKALARLGSHFHNSCHLRRPYIRQSTSSRSHISRTVQSWLVNRIEIDIVLSICNTSDKNTARKKVHGKY
jgi:hypothetical protein